MSATALPAAVADDVPDVRRTVRALLESVPGFAELDEDQRRSLAQGLVQVCRAAAALADEEEHGGTQAREAGVEPTEPLAAAQSAGDEFSGVSAQRVASTTQAILNAVSFPRFVTDLLNGVFKAIIDSSMQQLDSYVELLNNVAASTEGFADANMGPDRARQWLADRYPGSFELSGEEDPEFRDPDEPADRTLRLRPGASMPSPEAMRVDLGLAEGETVPSGDPERTLVPLARRRLAAMRQEMLATMVMLGMQRIVIDSGRIAASMRFHIDTRSAAQEDRGNTLDFRNTIDASGSFGTGVWGASVRMQNTIGYVSTQQTQTTEEMNTDLDLNSSVEVVFRSDYLPLNRLAPDSQVAQIRENSRNPSAEAEEAIRARTRRAELAGTSDTARRAGLDARLRPPSAPPPAPRPGEPGSVQDAERVRREAAAREEGTARRGQPPAPPPGGGAGNRPAADQPRPPAADQPRPPAADQPRPPAADGSSFR
jgi:hypothetical protein